MSGGRIPRQKNKAMTWRVCRKIDYCRSKIFRPELVLVDRRTVKTCSVVGPVLSDLGVSNFCMPQLIITIIINK